MSNYAHALAYQRNRQLARNDIEWAVSPDGQLYLRDRFDWTTRRTRELESQSEQSRREWKRAQEGTGE